jgi:anti-anti-sigma factor
MARHLSYRITRPKARKGLAVVHLAGFINAATLFDFEAILDELLLEKRLDAALDFDQISYINSSGLGALIHYHQSWREKGDELVLVRVHRAVASVMEALGLVPIVPILKDEAEAMAYLQRNVQGARVYPDHPSYLRERGGASTAPGAIPLARTAATKLDAGASVLVIEPRTDLFTEVLERRFTGNRKRFTLVPDCRQAMERFEQIDPQVVILRNGIEGGDEFLRQVKGTRGKSLVSVIKLYAREEDLKRPQPFRIWENDFFAEPFEILELFVLAEQELRRVPARQKALLHQTHFELTGTEEHIHRAVELSEEIFRQLRLPEETRQPLTAAFREALDNAWRHGHRRAPHKPIDVVLHADPEKIAVTVTDRGKGFEHQRFLEELKDEQAYVRARKMKRIGRRGGLGILMMHKCADKLEYLGRGNQVRLTKRMPAPPAAAAS